MYILLHVMCTYQQRVVLGREEGDKSAEQMKFLRAGWLVA